MREGRRADGPSGCARRAPVACWGSRTSGTAHYHRAKGGYAVLVMPNGADAVTQVRESRPDVLLPDLMVPQVNS